MDTNIAIHIVVEDLVHKCKNYKHFPIFIQFSSTKNRFCGKEGRSGFKDNWQLFRGSWVRKRRGQVIECSSSERYLAMIPPGKAKDSSYPSYNFWKCYESLTICLHKLRNRYVESFKIKIKTLYTKFKNQIGKKSFPDAIQFWFKFAKWTGFIDWTWQTIRTWKAIVEMKSRLLRSGRNCVKNLWTLHGGAMFKSSRWSRRTCFLGKRTHKLWQQATSVSWRRARVWMTQSFFLISKHV